MYSTKLKFFPEACRVWYFEETDKADAKQMFCVLSSLPTTVQEFCSARLRIRTVLYQQRHWYPGLNEMGNRTECWKHTKSVKEKEE